jgi:hypothetical protein
VHGLDRTGADVIQSVTIDLDGPRSMRSKRLVNDAGATSRSWRSASNGSWPIFALLSRQPIRAAA